MGGGRGGGRLTSEKQDCGTRFVKRLPHRDLGGMPELEGSFATSSQYLHGRGHLSSSEVTVGPRTSGDEARGPPTCMSTTPFASQMVFTSHPPPPHPMDKASALKKKKTDSVGGKIIGQALCALCWRRVTGPGAPACASGCRGRTERTPSPRPPRSPSFHRTRDPR